MIGQPALRARSRNSASMKLPSLFRGNFCQHGAPEQLEGEVHVAHAEAEQRADQVVVAEGVDRPQPGPPRCGRSDRRPRRPPAGTRAGAPPAAAPRGRWAGRRRCRRRGPWWRRHSRRAARRPAAVHGVVEDAHARVVARPARRRGRPCASVDASSTMTISQSGAARPSTRAPRPPRGGRRPPR